MKRRIISLTIAMLLILAMPLQAMAAEHDAANFNDVYNAFANDTDPEVTVNLTQDIEWYGEVTANEGQNYTVNGNGNDISGYVEVDGGGTVNVNADISGNVSAYGGTDVNVTGDVSCGEDYEGNSYGSIYASGEGSSVTVNGDVDVSDVTAGGSASVEVTGNVTADSISASYYIDNSTGEYIEVSGEITVTGDVEVEFGVNVGAGTVTVEGDVTGQYISVDGGTAAVAGDVEAGSVDVWNGELAVDGDVSAVESGIYMENGSIAVTGDVETFGFHTNNSTIIVDGNIDAEDIGISVVGGTAIIGGTVTSEHSNAVQAIMGSTVTIGGDAIGGSDVFTTGDGMVIANGGVGVVADDSNVTVKGNVVGGSVSGTAEANINQGGIGVAVMGNSVVNIEGDVTGGNITGSGIGGFGVYYDDYQRPFTGSVTVGGTVTGGKGGPNGTDGPAYVSSSTGIAAPAPEEAPAETPAAAPVATVPLSLGAEEVELAITVSDEEIVIEEMMAEDLTNLLDTLKETVKEDSPDTVTIDVSVYEEVTSIRIPVETLKAIIDAFGKLEIVFNGGSIIIDAAEFEKLVAELGFVTITLK